MKIGIMSDLHMELIPYEFTPEPNIYYFCAGDIHSSTHFRNEFVNKHKNHMMCIRGNHDFYARESFNNSKGELYTKEINGLKVAAATLWTDLSNYENWSIYNNYLNDSKYIKNLNYNNYNDTFETHKKFLFESEADIIMSHHCPSILSVHQKYLGNLLNCCFYTDLTEQILNMKKPPKIWIHGHTHEEFDYMIGETRVICHPRGYPNERPGWEKYKPLIIDI